MGPKPKAMDQLFNLKQKLVLGLSIAGILVCLLFPPWIHVWGLGKMSRPAGYSFIFYPPPAIEDGISIDLTRLIIQLIVIGIVGIALYYLVSNKTR